MSNRSRGRHRFEQSEPVDPEETERIEQATKAFEQANTRKGLAKLVGMILDDRKSQLDDTRSNTYVAPDGTQFDVGGPAREAHTGLAEMTPYHKSIAAGMADRPMYGGTVESWRIAKRRARNRIARKSRRHNRKRTNR